MRIDKIRSKTAVTVTETQTLNDAAHLMWTHDCGCTPVVDQQGVIKGMLTDRDIAMAAYLNGCCLSDIPVTRVMTRDVVCCRPGDTVLEVESRMQQHRIRRLPVLDRNKRVVGVISINDLANACGKGVAPETLAGTLAAVCERRDRTAA